MTATEKAGAEVDSLETKLRDIDSQLSTLTAEVETKRGEAAELIFRGKDAAKLEDNIARVESRIKTLQFVRATGQTKLEEAVKTLVAAKRSDAESHVREIHAQLDQAGNVLEDKLRDTLQSAKDFAGLLAEGYRFHQVERVQPWLPDRWVRLADPFRRPTIADIVAEALRQLTEHKLKNSS